MDSTAGALSITGVAAGVRRFVFGMTFAGGFKTRAGSCAAADDALAPAAIERRRLVIGRATAWRLV